MGIENLPIVTTLEHFDFLKGFGQIEFVLGLYSFPDESKGVTVRNGCVVVILVDVISKEGFGIVTIPNERCASEPNFDGLSVGLVEVGQETAFGVVATVNLIEEVNALEIETVIGCTNNVWIILELLDVNDGDLGAA
jgi:hypothetical protein